MTTCSNSCISQADPRFNDLDALIARAKETPGALIAVLHRAQELFGYLPEVVQKHIAAGLRIPPSDVYGVVTFYNLFSTEPVGRCPVNICLGTACYVRGADRVLARFKAELGIGLGEVTPDGLFSLETCRCMGACSLAPVITIGAEVHGKVTEQDVPRLVAQLRQAAAAQSPVGPLAEPARTADPARNAEVAYSAGVSGTAATLSGGAKT